MGLLDYFTVAGTTYDGAKASEPFHQLATIIHYEDLPIPIELQLVAANMLVRLYRSHRLYFEQGVKSEKVDAIKFLVAFTSYGCGRDGTDWDWEFVRDHSRGLYGSMDETPHLFRKYNSPLIDICMEEIKDFINENS